MAFSSFSSLSSGEYDVFLSFRGEDTRDNFTSHLYDALCRKKIKTFIDDERLRKGDDISPALLNAIEGSKISIIVFSEDYASSKWCLNELVKILQCHEMNGQMVVPIFYHVDPSNVRKQDGTFKDAFSEHETNFKDMPEKVMNWRAVLTKASNLAGWASKEIRSEAKLVDLIVRDVIKKLENVATSTDFDGFVGLNSRIRKINSLLCIGSSDFRVIGIWGMGGIGKTTIAGVIFNQNFRKFEGKCFLGNVREELEKGVGLVYLRERVLSEILEENIQIGNPVLPEYIKRRLRQINVLIVLDDVNKMGQLQYLTGGLDRFGLGSRIIITTRDRRVLDDFGVCNTNIYEVNGLNYYEALKLFSNYAFKEKHCPCNLLKLLVRVLKYANGNPLALRVLGSFFHQKSELDWEKALEYLNRISNPDIYDVLKISYNDLQPEVKSIFLDIACFFAGEDKEFVTRILDDPNIPHFGLNILYDKSLITISSSDTLHMHDLLQEMGREIIRQESLREPSNRSRLWYHKDVEQVLRKNKGTEAIEGIFLDLSKVRDINLPSRAFVNMPNLRLLKFYIPECCGRKMKSKVHLKQGLEHLPGQLRYLHWHEYSLKSLPSDFELENLIELSLPYSKVEQLWEGEKEALKLISMDLCYSQSLIRIPKPSEIPNLQIINLSNCKSLFCFPTVHNVSSPLLLSGLSTLVQLNLRDCALMEIPPNISCLSSLESLDLSLNDFESLPASMKQLSRLGSLSLTNCHMLQSLPELPLSVTSLKASNCMRLQSLPKVPSCSEGLDISILEILSSRSSNAPMLMDFRFTNCRFLEESQQIFQNMVIASLSPRLKKEFVHPIPFSLCLPGSKIPDWISNRSSDNSITIQLPQNCGNRNFIGFAVCVVYNGLDPSSTPTFVECAYHFWITEFKSISKFVAKNCKLNFDRDVFFSSEHILLGFCPCFDVELPDSDHHTTVTFEFNLLFNLDSIIFPLGYRCKCCGVCPLYLNPKETKPTTLTLEFAASSQEEIGDAMAKS